MIQQSYHNILAQGKSGPDNVHWAVHVIQCACCNNIVVSARCCLSEDNRFGSGNNNGQFSMHMSEFGVVFHSSTFLLPNNTHLMTKLDQKLTLLFHDSGFSSLALSGAKRTDILWSSAHSEQSWSSRPALPAITTTSSTSSSPLIRADSSRAYSTQNNPIWAQRQSTLGKASSLFNSDSSAAGRRSATLNISLSLCNTEKFHRQIL